MLKALKFIIVTALLVSIAPVYANEKLWEELQDRAIDLYQAKKHQEAVDTQCKALEVAKQTFGAEDIRVAESMDNLAIYSQAVGDNIAAEDLYKKALAILEKKLPPNDHYLAIFMNYVAGFYRKIGKPGEAARLEEKAKKIRAMK